MNFQKNVILLQLAAVIYSGENKLYPKEGPTRTAPKGCGPLDSQGFTVCAEIRSPVRCLLTDPLVAARQLPALKCSDNLVPSRNNGAGICWLRLSCKHNMAFLLCAFCPGIGKRVLLLERV